MKLLFYGCYMYTVYEDCRSVLLLKFPTCKTIQLISHYDWEFAYCDYCGFVLQGYLLSRCACTQSILHFINPGLACSGRSDFYVFDCSMSCQVYSIVCYRTCDSWVCPLLQNEFEYTLESNARCQQQSWKVYEILQWICGFTRVDQKTPSSDSCICWPLGQTLSCSNTHL